MTMPLANYLTDLIAFAGSSGLLLALASVGLIAVLYRLDRAPRISVVGDVD